MVIDSTTGSDARPETLGALLIAFSAVTSEGLGLGHDHGLRVCYIGIELAERMALSPDAAADVFYASLAKDGGCTCGASQMAAFLGTDEREAMIDFVRSEVDGELDMLRWLFRNAGRGAGPTTRIRRTVDALVHGSRFEHDSAVEECEVAQLVALRLGLGEGVASAVGACIERWDGKGGPRKLAGDGIPLAARVVSLASGVEIAERLSGRDAAIELARERSGAAFDPRVAEAFLALSERAEFWERLGADDLVGRVLEAEPAETRGSSGGRLLDRFTEVLADLVDLKRPATAGHARRVAGRTRALAQQLGLSAGERATLRRAALIHDLGLVSVSARDLDRGEAGGPYRVHPLGAMQLLADFPSLREACQIAALHHERADGSGWPAGSDALRGRMPAQILAACCALDESDGPSGAESALQRLADSGLDRRVVSALAEQVGSVPTVDVEPPAGLTAREVEVLRLASTGLNVREIGQRLVISRHTARHHLEAIYSKIGCSSRAAAALFAAEHGLLD